MLTECAGSVVIDPTDSMTEETLQIISYRLGPEAWSEFPHLIHRLASRSSVRRVCELGGGANPLLPLEFVRQRDLSYTILDISAEELAKAPAAYEKIQADLSSKEFSPSGEFDFVFDKMLVEHVADAETFHRNVFRMLAPNGIAVHFFPTLYAFPFVVNLLFPERAAYHLLDLLSPRDKYWKKKFPAHYDWCFGPTEAQIRRFEGLGYEVVGYRGFYGHGRYYRKIPPLRKLHEAMMRTLVRRPIPALTSFAWVMLRKPGPGTGELEPSFDAPAAERKGDHALTAAVGA